MTPEAERRELERLLRGWLLQRPKPSTLRLLIGDEARAVAIPANATWANIAATVVKMRPDQIEALDGAGGVLRVTDFAELAGDELDVQIPGAPTLPTPAPGTAPPLEPFTVPSDPESQRFALVARLLADAYKHSTDVAFQRLAEIAERGEARTASLERSVDSILQAERARLARYQRELDEREEELEERVEEVAEQKGNGAVDQLVQHFAKSFADDDEKPTEQPNGKAH